MKGKRKEFHDVKLVYSLCQYSHNIIILHTEMRLRLSLLQIAFGDSGYLCSCMLSLAVLLLLELGFLLKHLNRK